VLKQVSHAVVSFTLAAELGMPRCCLPHWQLLALLPMAAQSGLFGWSLVTFNILQYFKTTPQPPVNLFAFENRQDVPAVAKETGNGFKRIR
jgi:hypothetical protein